MSISEKCEKMTESMFLSSYHFEVKNCFSYIFISSVILHLSLHYQHVLKIKQIPFIWCFPRFFKLRFTPCKAEQPTRSIELQEKEAQED